MTAVRAPAVDGPAPASLAGFLRSLWPGHPPYAVALSSGEERSAITVVVERSTVVEVDCASRCPRGIAHDIQALLVLASAGTVPRPRELPEVRWPEPGPPPPGVAVRIAVTLLEAASERRPARLPMAWLGPGSDLGLGPGPGRGGELRLREAEWGVLRQLVSGGFPAVSASGDWEIASRLLAEGAVRLEGTEECGVFSRPGVVAAGVATVTPDRHGSPFVASNPGPGPGPGLGSPAVTDRAPGGVAPLPRRVPLPLPAADPVPVPDPMPVPAPAPAGGAGAGVGTGGSTTAGAVVEGRRRALREARRAAERAARAQSGRADPSARPPLEAVHQVSATIDQAAPVSPVSMSTLRRLVEALRAL